MSHISTDCSSLRSAGGLALGTRALEWREECRHQSCVDRETAPVVSDAGVQGSPGTAIAHSLFALPGDWSVGLIGDLRLRLRVEGGRDITWNPGIVLLSERSILGIDLCRDLGVWPMPTASASRQGDRALVWRSFAE